MKTVYINSQPVKLGIEIGGGQEAVVYDIGNNMVAKIWREPNDPFYANNKNDQQAAAQRLSLYAKKLKQFPRQLPPHIIGPKDFVTNKNGVIIGYTMQFVRGAEVLIKYGDMAFRQQMNISNNEIVDIFKHLHTTLQQLHQRNIVIGDFNDLNVLVKDKQVYMIDTDSYQFGNYPCTMYTDKFLDPLICQLATQNNVSFMQMVSPHTRLTDWYAYTIMLMKSLLFVHPYGGVHKPKDPSKKVKDSLRTLQRVSIFDKDVLYPRHAYPLQVLPQQLNEYFHKVLHKDVREMFPVHLIQNLVWHRCQSCGIEHATLHCLVCQVQHVILSQQSSANIKVVPVFQTSGTIVYTAVMHDKLYYIYHENGMYKRENGRVVIQGNHDRGLYFGINGNTTLLAKEHMLVSINPHEDTQKIAVDMMGNVPCFVSNADDIFWASNGILQRANTMGLQFTPYHAGMVLQGRTALWLGDDFGFGLYTAGGILQGFLFDAKSAAINDQCTIPTTTGQIINADCIFGHKRCWLLLQVKQGSQYINICYAFNQQGKLLGQWQTHADDGSWLATITGKCATGPYLFSPTNDGVVRVEFDDTGVVHTKQFTDTAAHVHEKCQLQICSNGIYVIKNNSINLLTLS